MEEKLIEAFRLMKNESFTSASEIVDSYTLTEILETYLINEGIVGYTNQILSIIKMYQPISDV